MGRSRNRSGSGGGGGGSSGCVGRALFSRLARGRERYHGRAGRSGGGYLPLRPRRPRLARYLYYSAVMGSQSRGMAKIRNRQIKRNKGGERGARGRYDDRFISARMAEVGPNAARTPSLRGPAGNRRPPQTRAAHPEQWRSSRTATDRRRPQWVVWWAARKTAGPPGREARCRRGRREAAGPAEPVRRPLLGPAGCPSDLSRTGTNGAAGSGGGRRATCPTRRSTATPCFSQKAELVSARAGRHHLEPVDATTIRSSRVARGPVAAARALCFSRCGRPPPPPVKSVP